MALRPINFHFVFYLRFFWATLESIYALSPLIEVIKSQVWAFACPSMLAGFFCECPGCRDGIYMLPYPPAVTFLSTGSGGLKAEKLSFKKK